MKTVLLFFCAILIFIIVAIILLILSTIKLNVKNINVSNIENGSKKEKIEKQILIYLEIYLFGKIKIAKIKISPQKICKLIKKENLEDVKKDMEAIKKINPIETIKMLQVKFEKVDMNAEIGTEDVFLTVFLVTFLSTLLGVLFRNSDYRNINYNIMPMYKFGNTIKINLKCIISVKMVHIIYVIYKLGRKGLKNERTSNRRSYDYSYE